MPEISIIVPVYMVEKYLARCIKSILAQTFTDFELILVDDGSLDDSGKICDLYEEQDTRVHVIHKKNGGSSSARNAGLTLAKGNYISFIDSDDWIAPNLYQYLYNLIKRTQADISACEYIVTFSESKKIKQPKEKLVTFNKDDMMKYFFRVKGEASNYCVCNKLISAKILYGFSFVENKINEDVIANFEFFMRANLMVLSNQILYYYFYNKEGVTNSKFTNKHKDLLDAWDLIINKTIENLPAYVNYAFINRKRANFTLLSKMFLKGFDDEFLTFYNDLRNKVKQDIVELLRWKMPLNRKLFIIILCIFRGPLKRKRKPF